MKKKPINKKPVPPPVPEYPPPYEGLTSEMPDAVVSPFFRITKRSVTVSRRMLGDRRIWFIGTHAHHPDNPKPSEQGMLLLDDSMQQMVHLYMQQHGGPWAMTMDLGKLGKYEVDGKVVRVAKPKKRKKK